MTDKILCVDDDQNILDGFQRQLRKSVALTTRASGDEGLKAVKEIGPFSVVISDMQMPNMDGVTFLAKVREIAPDTIRMMLTGNADQQTAMNAVNNGNIFRFLTKPCTSDVLLKAIEAGIAQHRLITAERDLEKTVKGCVQVLTDMLALANPLAMSRTMRVKHYVQQIAGAMGLGNIWQLEIAAMLSHVGCIAIPVETLRHAFEVHAVLSAQDEAMFNSHTRLARDLIATIPRLEFVAEMVAHQNDSFRTAQADTSLDGAVVMGASILKVAGDLDMLLQKSKSLESSVKVMEIKNRTSGEYNPAILQRLENVTNFEWTDEVEHMGVKNLSSGMVLARDIQSHAGHLMLSAGQVLNTLVLIHLENQVIKGNVNNDIYIRKRC